ncbi:glycosyltransferase [Methylocaldum sp.]|uniref:glycosyltransferase n=1 Tax=Methylocaldum sp. TaxID=1969727 RepID=UPI002D42BFBA|nr:glycosyltransferase [Methylocaldum sp.]HYE37877.1 glycosyltransferase [Methylocaldum sp.]
MLLTLLQRLDREQFLPYVVVPYQGQLVDEIKLLDIPVMQRSLLHWVPSIRAVKGNNRLIHLFHVLRGLRARVWAVATLIERNQIDLVYTNTVTCIEGAIAARMTNTPHVWHIHEPTKQNSELAPLLPATLYSTVIGTLSSSVIFPAQIVAKTYKTLKNKAAVVYNGLKIPELRERTHSRAYVARCLGLDVDMKWVAVVGALQPRKDHDTFLCAAKKILSKRSDVVFLIIGTGPQSYTSSILKRIDSNGLQSSVKLAGRWPEEIQYVMAAIDVLVISSEQESFGLTAIEALAMETPVVSTRCGGPEEIIEDGINGYLVPVKDAEAMSDAILDLLSNPEKARAFGSNGRQLVGQRFTDQMYVTAIQKIMFEAACLPNSLENSNSRT